MLALLRMAVIWKPLKIFTRRCFSEVDFNISIQYNALWTLKMIMYFYLLALTNNDYNVNS